MPIVQADSRSRKKHSKRGNNEGSIYYDARKKRHIGAVTLENGKKKVFSGMTAEEARSKVRKALEAIEEGSPLPSGRVTVASWLHEWMTTVAVVKLKDSTYESYEYYVNGHIMPVLGKHLLTKLTPKQVQQFLNERTAQFKWKPATTVRARAILSAALKVAVQRELIRRNVATLVEVPPVEVFEGKPLTADEAERVLAAAEGHPYAHVWAFLLGSGFRVGEVLALRWHDDNGNVLVDLDERIVKVRYTLRRRSAGKSWRIVEQKTASGRRTVPLIGPALEAIRAQRRANAEARLALGAAWQDNDLVFCRNDGTPLRSDSVLHAFRRMLVKAGLSPVTRVHDLRHSMATYLLKAGIDRRIVMNMMGWSQPAMLSRYQHVQKEMLEETARRLEEVLPLTGYMERTKQA